MATSHKRETARRKPRAAMIAGPLAALATGAAVTVGVLGAGPTDSLLAADATGAGASIAGSSESLDRAPGVVSRGGGDRLAAVELSPVEELLTKKAVAKAIKKAHEKLWTTTVLNLWTSPDEDDATKVGEIDSAKKVLVTGRSFKGREEVVVDGKARWVTSGYLDEDKPVGAGAGLSMEPCPDGSVESGLTDGAVYVYRSVCHAFPQITSYGGWDNHGEHTSGKAIDIMTSDVALGDAIAEFLQSHASELGLYDIIWRQRIWTPVRASEGWRQMSSRGSATANHYDHVHVSVN